MEVVEVLELRVVGVGGGSGGGGGGSGGRAAPGQTAIFLSPQDRDAIDRVRQTFLTIEFCALGIGILYWDVLGCMMSAYNVKEFMNMLKVK